MEEFTDAMAKLQQLGFAVNVENSELVYRGTAGEPLFK